MREIKFRAWDSRTKEMIYETTNSYLSFRCVNGEVSWCFDGTINSTSRPVWDITDYVIPMQYTGLLDKNGKEIYEGDIIKSDENAISKVECVVAWSDYGHWGVHPTDSRFFNGKLGDMVRSHSGGHKPKDGVSGYVIGNIYENPELLNEKMQDV